MNLVHLLKSQNVAGIPLKEYEAILKSESDTKIRSSGNGIIMLDNKKIIKCVSEYYYNPADPKFKKAKTVNPCPSIHRNLGVDHVSSNDCRACHLMCLIKSKSHQILRKA